MAKETKKRVKLVDKSSDKLTDSEKNEIKEFLRSQAKIIIQHLKEEANNE